jgi:hypothetical protein
MKDSFRESLKTQRLDAHKTNLKSLGFEFVEEHADEGRKQRDLYDWASDVWFEAKTDRSKFTTRLLVEYKANVPERLLEGIPLRRPLRASQYVDRLTALPSRFDALALDAANLERRHFLSYHFEQTYTTHVLDLRELRALVADHERLGLEWFVVGHESEHWRTVAVAVPLSLTRPLKRQDLWTGQAA